MKIKLPNGIEAEGSNEEIISLMKNMNMKEFSESSKYISVPLIEKKELVTINKRKYDARGRLRKYNPQIISEQIEQIVKEKGKISIGDVLGKLGYKNQNISGQTRIDIRKNLIKRGIIKKGQSFININVQENLGQINQEKKIKIRKYRIRKDVELMKERGEMASKFVNEGMNRSQAWKKAWDESFLKRKSLNAGKFNEQNQRSNGKSNVEISEFPYFKTVRRENQKLLSEMIKICIANSDSLTFNSMSSIIQSEPKGWNIFCEEFMLLSDKVCEYFGVKNNFLNDSRNVVSIIKYEKEN
ncbi:MAG: hypothetical protein Q7R52_02530 [archaeon]|nr:hypothetical protein [archaeon]